MRDAALQRTRDIKSGCEGGKAASARVESPPPQPSPASGRGGRPHLLRYRLKEQPAVSSSYHHATLLASFPTQPATRRTALPLPLAGEGWGGDWLAPMAVTPPSWGAAPGRRRGWVLRRRYRRSPLRNSRRACAANRRRR